MRRSILILIFLLFVAVIKMWSQPTAELAAVGETAFCESGAVDFKIKFSGTSPFGYAIQLSGIGTTYYFNPIFNNDPKIDAEGWYHFTLNLNQTTTVSLVKVWDNSTTPWDKATGADVLGQSVDVTVNKMPVPIIGSYSPNCGTSITLNATPDVVSTTYYWESAGGTFSDNKIANPVFTSTNQAEGTFSLTFVQENGTCKATVSTNVTLRTTPRGAVSGSQDVCLVSGTSYQLDATVDLSGHAPFSYVLSDGINAYNRSSSTDGTVVTQVPATTHGQSYSITSVKDVNGCFAVASDLSGSATVNDLSPIANAGADVSVCGLDAELSASVSKGVGTWSIVTNEVEVTVSDLSDSAPTLTASAYGTTEFKWTANNEGCLHSDHVIVEFKEPASLNLIKDKQVITLGQSATMKVELSGISPWVVEYQEESESNVVELQSALDQVIFTPPVTTTYTVLKVVGANGCMDVTEKAFVVSVETFKTYNGFSPNGDGVNDFFVVDGLNEGMNGVLTVFDHKGVIVYKQSDYDNTWSGVGMDGQPLPDGIYYFEFKSSFYDPVHDYVVIKRHVSGNSNQ